MSRIGTLGSAVTFEVAAGGAVLTPAGAVLDWLVGAADRWHEPSAAAAETGTAVTQRREGGLPIVTTGLRVPGGQIVHRSWSVAAGGGDVAVVELENRSRDAVAVAFVLRATGGAGTRFDGDRRVEVGGVPALVAGRPVARVVAGPVEAVRATLTAGDATAPSGPVTGEAVGLVLPLAHTARLRVVLPAPGVEIDPAAVDTLPGPDAVAAGWRTHLDAGARVVLPDERLADSVAASRVRLLLDDGVDLRVADAAVVALGLGWWGHLGAAARVLDAAGGPSTARVDPATTVDLLAAWAAATRGHAGEQLDHADALGTLDERAEAAARLAHRLDRRAARRALPSATVATAQLDAAELLDRAGQPEAAALCRERAAAVHPAAVAAPPAMPDPLVADAAGATASARFLVAVRRALADDAEPGVIRLLAGHPDDWLGQDVEVHHVPTRAGQLSYAVRWHGVRPAILWELLPDPVGGQHQPALLTVPGLDPDWSSAAPAGEALLAPVEPAGGLPKVVAPLAGDGTPVDEAPGDGVSFS